MKIEIINMKAKTIFSQLFVILVTVFFYLFPSTCFSQEQSSEEIEALAEGPNNYGTTRGPE